MKHRSLIMVFFLLCLNAVLPAILFAGFDDTKICGFLEEKRKEAKIFEDFKKMFKDASKILFHKKDIARPVVLDLPIRGQQWVEVDDVGVDYEGENIIFSLGFDDHEGQKQENIQSEQRFQELENAIKQEQKVYKKLLRSYLVYTSRSKERCERRRIKYQFSYNRMLELNREKNTLIYAQQLREGAQAYKYVKRALKHIKLNWRHIHGADINTVHQYLKSHKVANVIIVTHGRAGGEILDSDQSIYPMSFFKNISPTLRSIALFSCYSKEAVDFYGLQNILKDQETIYGKRYIFHVAENELYGKKNVAPMNTLAYFIRAVDKVLHKTKDYGRRSMHALMLPKLDFSEDCFVHTSDFQIKKGTIGVEINRQFIGAFEYGDKDPVIPFACKLLKTDGKKNLLIFSNLRLNNQTTEEGNQFTVNIETPFGEADVLKENHFTNDDLYSKSVFSFVIDRSVSDESNVQEVSVED